MAIFFRSELTWLVANKTSTLPCAKKPEWFTFHQNFRLNQGQILTATNRRISNVALHKSISDLVRNLALFYGCIRKYTVNQSQEHKLNHFGFPHTDKTSGPWPSSTRSNKQQWVWCFTNKPQNKSDTLFNKFALHLCNPNNTPPSNKLFCSAHFLACFAFSNRWTRKSSSRWNITQEHKQPGSKPSFVLQVYLHILHQS